MRRLAFALLLLVGSAAPAAAQDSQLPTTPPSDRAAYLADYRATAHALVIGNSAYQKPNVWPVLNSPARDGNAMRQALGPHVTLHPRSGDNLTLAQMKTALEEFIKTVQRDEKARIALVYFSGHGITHQGKGLLLPVDAPERLNNSFAGDVWSITKLMERLNQSRAAARILVLDACRNVNLAAVAQAGALRPLQYAMAQFAQSDAPPPAPAVAAGLPQIAAPEGILIAYATHAGGTAADGEPNGHSLYTSYLLKHVAKPEPLQDIFSQVSGEVRAKTSYDPWLSQVGLYRSLYIHPPVDYEAREHGWWQGAQKNPQLYLRDFIDHREFQHSIYRPAALALEKQLVASGELPPRGADVQVAASARVAVQLPEGQSVTARDASSGQVMARVPAGGTAVFDAVSLTGERFTVMGGSRAVGTVAKSALPPAAIPQVLAIDLEFRPDRAELSDANAGDYLGFMRQLRDRPPASLDIITAGDRPGDTAMAVIRAEALRESIVKIAPDLAGRIRVRPDRATDKTVPLPTSRLVAVMGTAAAPNGSLR